MKAQLNAIDFIRIHKKSAIIVGGVLIIGGAVAGTVGYIATRDKRKREKQFAINLQAYLDAARKGKLTVEILDSLIDSLNALSNDDPTKADKSKNIGTSIWQFNIQYF